MSKVIIIGGGISGLSAAYYLNKFAADSDQPVEVTILEARGNVGGSLHSHYEEESGIVVEMGADSFIATKGDMLDLCDELGLTQKLTSTNELNRRSLVAAKDQLEPLPTGFVMIAPTNVAALLGSPLFSLKGKLRAMLEPFIPRKKIPDESVSAFVTRRFGREVLIRAAEAMVGGIYTGDAKSLSARAALPRFVQLEEQYGSVTRGLQKEDGASNTSGARYNIFRSFSTGMQSLVDALKFTLPEGTVRFNTPVQSVRQSDQGWKIVAGEHELTADAVIIACSAIRAGDLLKEVDAMLAKELRQIRNASSVVLNLLFRKSDIRRKLDGFGFVVPIRENKKMLAAGFISVKFSNRAPAECEMIRVFFGGALKPELLNLADEDLVQIACQELKTYLKIEGTPVKTWVQRWMDAMPQYLVGHQNLVSVIEERVKKFPTLALAGNSYNGVGIADCVLSGRQAARKISTTLAQAPVVT